jgi:hypothetical protein
MNKQDCIQCSIPCTCSILVIFSLPNMLYSTRNWRCTNLFTFTIYNMNNKNYSTLLLLFSTLYKYFLVSKSCNQMGGLRLLLGPALPEGPLSDRISTSGRVLWSADEFSISTLSSSVSCDHFHQRNLFTHPAHPVYMYMHYLIWISWTTTH